MVQFRLDDSEEKRSASFLNGSAKTGHRNPVRTTNKVRSHLRAALSWAWEHDLVETLPRFPDTSRNATLLESIIRPRPAIFSQRRDPLAEVPRSRIEEKYDLGQSLDEVDPQVESSDVS